MSISIMGDTIFSGNGFSISKKNDRLIIGIPEIGSCDPNNNISTSTIHSDAEYGCSNWDPGAEGLKVISRKTELTDYEHMALLLYIEKLYDVKEIEQ